MKLSKFLKLSTYALTFFLFTPLMMSMMLINRYQSDEKVNKKSLRSFTELTRPASVCVLKWKSELKLDDSSKQFQ